MESGTGKRGRMNQKSGNTEQGKIGNDEGGTLICIIIRWLLFTIKDGTVAKNRDKKIIQ
jgi:hypothetical protein